MTIKETFLTAMVITAKKQATVSNLQALGFTCLFMGSLLGIVAVFVAIVTWLA